MKHQRMELYKLDINHDSGNMTLTCFTIRSTWVDGIYIMCNVYLFFTEKAVCKKKKKKKKNSKSPLHVTLHRPAQFCAYLKWQFCNSC